MKAEQPQTNEGNPVIKPCEGLSAGDRKLLVWFNKLLRIYQKIQDELLVPYGLSKFHALYLLYLYDYPEGILMTEITKAMGMDKANTTRVVSDLAAKDCLVKTRESERKTTVALTAHGRQIASLCVGTAMKWRTDFLGLLSEEDGAKLLELLLKFAEAMERSDT